MDSSLIMEIAGHFNPNVTAIILGTPDSEDAKYAVRFCRERGYKYHLIGPVVNFHRIVKKIIYQAESYEPGIIYQGIATEQCAEAAKKLGINICLSGEGADSLFCGFNEYIPFCTEKKWISRHSSSFVKKMGSGHLRRVDRMAMKYGVEIRLPFLDKEVVNLACNMDTGLKIRKKDGSVVTKYILRKMAGEFLPQYICGRRKLVFDQGAGIKIDSDEYRKIFRKMITKKFHLPARTREKYSIKNEWEAFCLSNFINFGYDKLAGCEKRMATLRDIRSETQ